MPRASKNVPSTEGAGYKVVDDFDTKPVIKLHKKRKKLAEKFWPKTLLVEPQHLEDAKRLLSWQDKMGMTRASEDMKELVPPDDLWEQMDREMALRAAKEAKGFTIQEFRARYGFKHFKAWKILKEMVEEGKLETIGATNQRRYVRGAALIKKVE